MFPSMHFDLSGGPLTDAEWARRKNEWLPAPSDREACPHHGDTGYEPGKSANYIAPPVRGINRQPIDLEARQDRGMKTGLGARGSGLGVRGSGFGARGSGLGWDSGLGIRGLRDSGLATGN